MATTAITFSGRCKGRELRAQAMRRAHQARYMAQWRAMNPEPEKYIERQMWGMLLAMAAVLGLAFGLHAYDAPRPTKEPQRHELAHNHFEWYTSDYLND